MSDKLMYILNYGEQNHPFCRIIIIIGKVQFLLGRFFYASYRYNNRSGILRDKTMGNKLNHVQLPYM